MTFYLRILPGLRARFGRRGVRLGIGPRAARLHVGGGKPAAAST
jgi:hypothetical protein